MTYPKFFDSVEPIKLYDPLSEFLGAVDDGIIEFSYLDVVKNAGHSCPTVAGAYLMAQVGLKALYRDEIPQRGDILVRFADDEINGVTGVIANVFSQITGAMKENGFKGIDKEFSRVGLMAFAQEINATMEMQRLDNSKTVSLTYDPGSIQPDPKHKELLGKILHKQATYDEKREFKTLWQKRVADILNNADKVIILK